MVRHKRLVHPEQSHPEQRQDEEKGKKRNTQLQTSSIPDASSMPAIHGQDQMPWTEQPLPIPEHTWGPSIHANSNTQQFGDFAQVRLRTAPG